MVTPSAQYGDTCQICVYSEILVYTFVVALLLALTIKKFLDMFNNYIDEQKKWRDEISAGMNEMRKDVKSIVNSGSIFGKDEKLMDNQDLCLALHISHRTLQRYRTGGHLPFYKHGQKIFYKMSEVREFINRSRRLDTRRIKGFEDAMPTVEI